MPTMHLCVAAFLAAVVSTRGDCEEGSCDLDGDAAALLQHVSRAGGGAARKQTPSPDLPTGGELIFNYSTFQEAAWAVDFPDCSQDGQNPFQSPINIAVDGVKYPPLDVSAPPRFIAENGGCKVVDFRSLPATRQVQISNRGPESVGSAEDCLNLRMIWRGRTYFLEQFHFHTRSEHSRDFENTAMEMHLVHATKAEAGEEQFFAVVAVFIRADKRISAQNNFLRWVFKQGFPPEIGDKTVELKRPINPYEGVLHPKGKFWYYTGSLTTPPCSGGVDWIVAQDEVAICPKTVTEFMEYLSTGDRVGNSYGLVNRPIQPLNGRSASAGNIQVGRFSPVRYHGPGGEELLAETKETSPHAQTS